MGIIGTARYREHDITSALQPLAIHSEETLTTQMMESLTNSRQSNNGEITVPDEL